MAWICATWRCPAVIRIRGAGDLAATREVLANCPDDAVLLIDGLALGAMPPDMIAPYGRRIAALVHHPLGLESGLDEARAEALIENEAAVLGHCRRIIATSRLTGETLAADFGVMPEMNHHCRAGHGSRSASRRLTCRRAALARRRRCRLAAQGLSAARRSARRLRGAEPLASHHHRRA